MIELLRFPASADQRLLMRQELARVACGPRVVLETCDRLEIYRGEGAAGPAVQRHLVRVATGLESPLLGEKAVMGQVRSAFALAGQQGTLSKGLHRLFQDSIGIARKVRAQSGIDRGAVGHGQAVAEILRGLGRPQADELVLIIGINQLTAGIVRFLKARTGSNFILANRNFPRAAELAASLGIEARPLADLDALVPRAGVIISGTAAPHLIVHARHFGLAGNADSANPPPSPEVPVRLLFDLASPPDIDPLMERQAGYQLWGLQAVESHAQRNRTARRDEVKRAEGIIENELAKVFRPARASGENFS